MAWRWYENIAGIGEDGFYAITFSGNSCILYVLQTATYINTILYSVISAASNSPELVELKTSTGQLTTLFVEIPFPDESEITWQKDGLPVKHPVLPNGSLYITDTHLNNQGDYTMTAIDTNSVTSIRVQLQVINPQMPTG